MALIRCSECSKEISDKAAACLNCGAPVDVAASIHAPVLIEFDNGEFVATAAMMVELAKKAIGNLDYRIDAIDRDGGTATFTTGVSWGSWSGVSGTVSWEEAAPYRYLVSGRGKQNLKGGQFVAMNLFDEANGRARNVVDEMTRIAGGLETEIAEAPGQRTDQGGCLWPALIFLGFSALLYLAPIVARGG